MKILYGITKSNFGGAQRYVFDLAIAAKAARHDVAVICGGEGALVSKLKEAGIRTISIPGFSRDMDLWGDASRLLFIIKTVWHERPDVFHINSAKMGGAGIFTTHALNLYAKLTGKNYKLKAVFTAHGWAFNEPRPFWQKIIIKFFSWLTILSAHQTICVSERTREQISQWPFIKNKLRVVRNGIESFETLPRTRARQSLGIHDDALVVGTIAELHPIKGLDILIEAWSKFSKNRDTHLIIMGEGEERENLEERITALNLDSSVTLKGQVENAKQYLSAFDIFCLPSRSEALPYTILEAGLAGIPTIASRVGGIPEIIETGVNGALVEAENPSELLSTLTLLADDPVLRERLSKGLKETISKDFSIQKMTSETFALYQN